MILGIIGTALRGNDFEKMSKQKWNQVKHIVLKFVQDNKINKLISGGAAASDHLCVGLFNAGFVQYLELALPCHFDFDKNQFVEEGFKSCGNTANYYHRRFSKMMGKNSLEELSIAQNGQFCVTTIGKGFLDRNKVVAAKADIMLALTFGNKEICRDGGTSNTLGLFIKKNGNENAWHLDLNTMELHRNAVVSK